MEKDTKLERRTWHHVYREINNHDIKVENRLTGDKEAFNAQLHLNNDKSLNRDYKKLDFERDVDITGWAKVSVKIKHFNWGPEKKGWCSFRLSKNREVNWWKGIFIMSSSTERACQYELQGYRNDETTYNKYIPDIGDSWWVRIELWKAGFLGHHVHVADLRIRQEALYNTITEIAWIED